MFRNYSLLAFLTVLGLVAVPACGGDDDDASTGGTGGAAGSGASAGSGGVAGQAGEAGSAGAGGSGGTAGTAGSSGGAGTAGSAGGAGTAGSAGQGGAGGTGGGAGAACDALAIDLHTAENWYFTLADMTEHDTEPTSWDLKMGKTGAGPWITLGDGVEGVNLGNSMPFVDVIEAPETGYAADPDLIGGDWKSGGAGETGYDMSENVYVLKLADDTYAKLVVTEAKAGAITIDAFLQADGTRDLTCAQP